MSATCFRCAVVTKSKGLYTCVTVPIYKRRLALKIVHNCSILKNWFRLKAWLTAIVYIGFAMLIVREGYKKDFEANKEIKHRRMFE